MNHQSRVGGATQLSIMNMFERKGSKIDASKLDGASSTEECVEITTSSGAAEIHINDIVNRQEEVPLVTSDVAPSTKPIKLKRRKAESASVPSAISIFDPNYKELVKATRSAGSSTSASRDSSENIPTLDATTTLDILQAPRRSSRVRKAARVSDAEGPMMSTMDGYRTASSSSSRPPSPSLVIDIDTLEEPIRGTQGDPISIDESSSPPAKPKLIRAPIKAAPIFKVMGSQPKALIQQKRKTDEPPLPPFPDLACQHVQGVLTEFNCPPARFDKRASKLSVTNSLSEASFSRLLSGSSLDKQPAYRKPSLDIRHSAPEERANGVPAPSLLHPSISKLHSFSQSSSVQIQQEQWTQKWRPRKAIEVLGNEGSAAYLKAWLSSLALQVEQQNTNLDSDAPSGSLETSGQKATDNLTTTFQQPKRAILRSTARRPKKKRRLDSSDDEDAMNWIVEDPWNDKLYDTDFDGAGTVPQSEDVSEAPSSPPQVLTRLTRGDQLNPPDEESEDGKAGSSNIPELPPPATDDLFPTYDFSSYLTNTILLTGPPGSGKTAAIYACAEELDWEVFEVYPGIGKRSGTNLGTLIGDVGKNHLVSSGNKKGPSEMSGPEQTRATADKTRSFFTRRVNHQASAATSEGTSSVSRVGEDTAATPVTEPLGPHANADSNNYSKVVVGQGEIGPLGGGKTESSDRVLNASKPRLRQSIILLEEVDVLYAEDVNFWPAAINLIKDSRRAVVMTCNDPLRIPFGQIPLQTTLGFQPPPVALATTYLQRLALQEGFVIPKEDIAALYERTHPMNENDMSHDLLNATIEALPVSDLRRTIHHLQYFCQSQSPCSSDGPTEGIKDDHIEEPTERVIALQSLSLSPEIDADDEMTDWGAVDPARVHSYRHFGSERQGSTREEGNMWQELRRVTEALSFADGHLQRRRMREEDIGIGRPEDEEIGYTKVTHPTIPDESEAGVEFYNYEREIGGAVKHTAGLVWSMSGRSWTTRGAEEQREWGEINTDRSEEDTVRQQHMSARDLFGRQWHSLSKIWRYLVALLGPSGTHSTVSSLNGLLLDYDAWIRVMVRADDAMQAADEGEVEALQALAAATTTTVMSGETELAMSSTQWPILKGVGRMTRNSRRGRSYVRWVGLSEEQREALNDTALNVDDTFPSKDMSASGA